MRSDAMSEVFFALCKACDTARSLGAWLRFSYGEHKQLAEMPFHPNDYLDLDHIRKDYTVVSYLQKWKGLKTDVDLQGEALRRFADAEDRCRETNKRLRADRSRGCNPAFAAIAHGAKRRIARLLGPFSLFCIDGLYGWGPGATVELPRRRAFRDAKLGELPMTVSRRALPLARSVIERDLHWSRAILGVYPDGPYSLLAGVFELVEYDKITTVSKNAMTDRTIGAPPRLNGYLQKAVGQYFRRMLRRVGIDLDDQSQNQRLAERAIDLDLATLDEKSASDTTARELVYEFFPYDWWAFMDAIRTHEGLMPDGTVINYEKFSSMGNGFTFELETLIFWAIAQEVTDQEFKGGIVSIYGDDIICQKQVSSSLIAALDYFGYETNVKKTHVSGRFFESCGKHYFDGVEITPAYQKAELSEDVEAIRAGNRIIRLAQRWGSYQYLDKRLKGVWLAYRRLFPTLANHQIPFGVEGDDAWVVPFESFRFEQSSPNRGVRCRTLSLRYRILPAHAEAMLANWFHTHNSPPKGNPDVPGTEALFAALSGGQVPDCTVVATSDGWGRSLWDRGDDLTIPITLLSRDSQGKTERIDRWYPNSFRWVIPTGEFSITWR